AGTASRRPHDAHGHDPGPPGREHRSADRRSGDRAGAAAGRCCRVTEAPDARATSGACRAAPGGPSRARSAACGASFTTAARTTTRLSNKLVVHVAFRPEV